MSDYMQQHFCFCSSSNLWKFRPARRKAPAFRWSSALVSRLHYNNLIYRTSRTFLKKERDIQCLDPRSQKAALANVDIGKFCTPLAQNQTHIKIISYYSRQKSHNLPISIHHQSSSCLSVGWNLFHYNFRWGTWQTCLHVYILHVHAFFAWSWR